jgi:DNA-binding NarL/FixJ family response regulator
VIQVVIADDHPVFRRGLARAIGATDGMEVVGEAAEGRQACDVVRRFRPQVAIVDLQMPGMHGLDVARTVARDCPEVGVLVLTMSEDEATVWAALRAGARGYLLKSADEEAIVRAVRAVEQGELVIGPGVVRRVLGFFDRPAPSPAGQAFPELTERERDVLEHLVTGAPNAVIAQRLGLSTKTVRNYVSAILLKLQVVDRGAAIDRAREAGVGNAGQARATSRAESREPGSP